MEGSIFHKRDRGVPQGGVISPLLANIILTRLEKDIESQLLTPKTKQPKKNRGELVYARYADDFIVGHIDLETIERVKVQVENSLESIGLKLSGVKTRIVHTKEKYNGHRPGFDFLGFYIRHVGKGIHNGSFATGVQREQKLLVEPSKKKVLKHLQDIRKIIKRHRNVRQANLISILAPRIRG